MDSSIKRCDIEPFDFSLKFSFQTTIELVKGFSCIYIMYPLYYFPKTFDIVMQGLSTLTIDSKLLSSLLLGIGVYELIQQCIPEIRIQHIVHIIGLGEEPIPLCSLFPKTASSIPSSLSRFSMVIKVKVGPKEECIKLTDPCFYIYLVISTSEFRWFIRFERDTAWQIRQHKPRGIGLVGVEYTFLQITFHVIHLTSQTCYLGTQLSY